MDVYFHSVWLGTLFTQDCTWQYQTRIHSLKSMYQHTRYYSRTTVAVSYGHGSICCQGRCCSNCWQGTRFFIDANNIVHLSLVSGYLTTAYNWKRAIVLDLKSKCWSNLLLKRLESIKWLHGPWEDKGRGNGWNFATMTWSIEFWTRKKKFPCVYDAGWLYGENAWVVWELWHQLP